MTYEWFIDCDVCGHEWPVEVQEGRHDEECPRCESVLTMDGEDVLFSTMSELGLNIIRRTKR